MLIYLYSYICNMQKMLYILPRPLFNAREPVFPPPKIYSHELGQAIWRWCISDAKEKKDEIPNPRGKMQFARL